MSCLKQNTLLALLVTLAAAESITYFPEQWLISDQTMGVKQFKYYQMTVSDDYVLDSDGNQSKLHLAISAFATSFNSDPDVYISKSNIARNAVEADWFCEREGSDTCILHSGEFAVDDTLFITVACRDSCSYELRNYYVSEYELSDGVRQTYQWEGHSTAILKYFVPQVSDSTWTRNYDVQFEAEGDYKHLEVFMSLDPTFHVIEERPSSHVLSDGVSIKISDTDYQWCTNCYVYFIVNVIKEKRVYVTATAHSRSGAFRDGIPAQVLINAGQTDCFVFSVDSKEDDLMCNVVNFQGNADLFLARRQEPKTISSSSVRLVGARQHPQSSFVVKTSDKIAWEAQIGTYYLCFQAYSAVSAQVTITQDEWAGVFNTSPHTLNTFFLSGRQLTQFRISSNDFLIDNVTLRIEVGSYENEEEHWKESTDLQVYYTVCTENMEEEENACKMAPQDASGEFGSGSGVERLELDIYSNIEEENDIKTYRLQSGFIDHQSKTCRDAIQCTYIFSVYNPSTSSTARKSSFLLKQENENIEDILPQSTYRNQVNLGSYVRYRILDSVSDLDDISALVIDLETFVGDADLFVGTSEDLKRPNSTYYDYESRRNSRFDRIVLNDTVYSEMPNHVYIAVYGNLRSEYEMKVTPVYHPQYNQKLDRATPLVERQGLYQEYPDETSSGSFFSFKPWWSDYEKRTIVVLADVLQLRVFFYIEKDDYPLHYSTKWLDSNDIWTLQSDKEGYLTSKEQDGVYYIRVIPDFALADMIASRAYKFRFYAFSQPPQDEFMDLYPGKEILGVAEAGRNTYYRHFLTDRSQTVKIQFTGLNRKGNPRIMVKLKGHKVWAETSRPETFDFKEELSDEVGRRAITLYPDTRFYEDPDCLYAGFAANGGSELCGIYIGVECGPGEPNCAFRIKLFLLDTIEDEKTGDITLKVPESLPPKYVTWDQTYLTDSVKYGEEQFYYVPVNYEETGDVLILVNKTGSFDSNGDVAVGLTVNKNASNINYKDWSLPSEKRNQTWSWVRDPVQPELIEICQAKLQQQCVEEDGCVLALNVRGMTEGLESHYRIKVFNGTNKIEPFLPIVDSIRDRDDWKYYWYVSHDAYLQSKTTKEQQEYWQNEIGLGIKTVGGDADLYISVMDGRYPTEHDFDFKSENLGSDWVTLTSNQTEFQKQTNHSYDPAVGMVVVIGVKAKTENVDYSLTLRGNRQFSYDVTRVNSNVAEIVKLEETKSRTANFPYVQIFKWYNWQHLDFRLKVDTFHGSADFYLNAIGESSYLENAISGVPLNVTNSVWSVSLNDTKEHMSAELILKKTDVENYPSFCYDCWYYLTVVAANPNMTEFRVYFNQLDDSGTDYLDLKLEEEQEVRINNQGEKRYVKFLLDSKDPFHLDFDVKSGKAEISVSPNPDTVHLDPTWSLTAGQGQSRLDVSGTDPNFHLATWYYVYFFALSDNTLIDVKVSQLRTVDLLSNQHQQKFQFESQSELVKFMVFQVPTHWSPLSLTTLLFESLTPHLYPSVYLHLLEFDDMPDHFENLSYPSLVDYDLKFGDNLSHSLYLSEFEYQFETRTTKPYAFYTLAVYQNSYGFSHHRKHEFKLTVTSVEKKQLTVQAAPTPQVQQSDDVYGHKYQQKRKVQHVLDHLEEDVKEVMQSIEVKQDKSWWESIF